MALVVLGRLSFYYLDFFTHTTRRPERKRTFSSVLRVFFVSSKPLCILGPKVPPSTFPRRRDDFFRLDESLHRRGRQQRTKAPKLSLSLSGELFSFPFIIRTTQTQKWCCISLFLCARVFFVSFCHRFWCEEKVASKSQKRLFVVLWEVSSSFVICVCKIDGEREREVDACTQQNE